MTSETKAIVDRLVEILKSFGAREVYLFGSAARGETRADSDLDLAVAGLPPRNFYRAVTRVMRAAGSPVDAVDLDFATPFTRYLRDSNALFRVG